MATALPSTTATPRPPAASSLPAPTRPSNLVAQLHATGLCLRDFQGPDLQRLQLRLLSYAKLLGLSNVPDDGQLRLLSGFLQRRFGDVTEAELDAALERWAAGELASDLRLYGSLSLDFLGGLLHAWRLERRLHLQRAERDRLEAEATAAEQDAVPPPDDFHDRLVRTYAAEHGELPPIADWQACWRHLRAAGHLPTLSPEELDRYQEQARRQLEELRRVARLTGRPLPEDPGTDEQRWHAYLREQRARAYYLHLLRPCDTTNPSDL